MTILKSYESHLEELVEKDKDEDGIEWDIKIVVFDMTHDGLEALPDKAIMHLGGGNESGSCQPGFWLQNWTMFSLFQTIGKVRFSSQPFWIFVLWTSIAIKISLYIVIDIFKKKLRYSLNMVICASPAGRSFLNYLTWTSTWKQFTRYHPRAELNQQMHVLLLLRKTQQPQHLAVIFLMDHFRLKYFRGSSREPYCEVWFELAQWIKQIDDKWQCTSWTLSDHNSSPWAPHAHVSS